MPGGLRSHAATWRSLYRWVRRSPRPLSGAAFPYAGALTPVLSIFVGLSVVEVAVVHLVLPGAWLRTAADVLGGYALLWMVGMLVAMRTHPHTVDDAGLRVRSGTAVELTVPWERIAAVRSSPRALTGMRTVQVEEGPPAAAALPVAGQTNVEVVLTTPHPLPGRGGRLQPVTVLRLFADDPRALVTHLRDGLGQRPPAASGDRAR